MDELNIEFNNYINEFKKLDKVSKMEEIITSIKELISFIDLLAVNNNISLSYLKSREILDLNNENVSEEDYLEATIVYIENAKNLLAQFLEKKSL